MIKSWMLLFLANIVAYLALASTTKPTIVDVLYVLDNHTMYKWTEHAYRAGHTVMDEAFSFFYEASLLLADINVELRMKYGEPLVLDVLAVQRAKERDDIHMDIDKALDCFGNWTFFNKKVDQDYDVAVLLTGCSLTAGYFTDHYGNAYQSGACSNDRYTVIENTYNQETVIALAHEIFHLLGGYHDGEREGYGCNSADGYIMANDTIPSPNFLSWSKCSRRDLDNFLKSNKSWCLREPAKDSVRITIRQAKRLIELVDADEICRRVYGVFSYAVQFCDYDGISPTCEVINCAVGFLSSWKKSEGKTDASERVAAIDGMPCGNHKRCVRGQCVNDPAVTFDNNCPHRYDQPFFVNSPFDTCYDAAVRGFCENADVKIFCCNMCYFYQQNLQGY